MLLALLRQIWNIVRSGLLFIGKVNSIILLAIFYYVILGPVAILVQLAQARKVKQSGHSYWQKRAVEAETEETLLRQF